MKAQVRAVLAIVVAVVALSFVKVGPADAWTGCLPHFDPDTGEIYTLCY